MQYSNAERLAAISLLNSKFNSQVTGESLVAVRRLLGRDVSPRTLRYWLNEFNQRDVVTGSGIDTAIPTTESNETDKLLALSSKALNTLLSANLTASEAKQILGLTLSLPALREQLESIARIAPVLKRLETAIASCPALVRRSVTVATLLEDYITSLTNNSKCE